MGKTFPSAVLAGICIGIAGFGNLAIGGIAGPVVFAFGLCAVVNYKFKLFTGTAGFIREPAELGTLCLILLGNILGCLAVGLLARVSPLPIQEGAQKILTARLSAGALRCGLLAIGCGFIMTTAVKFAREPRASPIPAKQRDTRAAPPPAAWPSCPRPWGWPSRARWSAASPGPSP